MGVTARILGSAIATWALAISGWTAPAQAATAGKLSTSTPSVASSGKLGFSGKLPTAVRRTVILQRKTSSGWTAVTKGKTSRRGKIGLTASAPSRAGKYTFRVKAPRHETRSKTYKTIKTPSVAVTVLAPAPPPPPAPAPPPPLGSRENPLSINTPFQSSVWHFTVGAADFDAWPEIAVENIFNVPPPLGWSYVTVPVTYTYLGTSTGSPFWDTELEYVGNNGIVYDDGISPGCGVVPNQVSDLGDMYPGATATGNECVPVPTSAIPGGMWRVSGETFPTNFVFVRAS